MPTYWVIIRPFREWFTSFVIAAIHAGWVELFVVYAPTGKMDPTVADSRKYYLVRNVYVRN
jgi:hypothetical protein